MSVAAQSLMDSVTYEDLYHRWEQGNWSAYDIDFSADKEGWDGLSDIQRRSAMWIYSMFFYGEDRVADTLAPYRHRGADRGAAVLPRDPAGRRGPPRGLLPPLLQGGHRGRRRHDPGDPLLHPAAAQLGLPRDLRPPRRDGRRTPQGPLAAEVRAGDHPLPPDRRGQPRPAGPALHRGLLLLRRIAAGLQLRDRQRLPRRAAPHRVRGQGPLRTARRRQARLEGKPGGGRSSFCARSSPTGRPSSRRRE